MTEYAVRTKVPANRTRLQIEALMGKHGADQFLTGGDAEFVVMRFRLSGRHLAFKLPLADARNEQQIRTRWRALLLVIKARMEAVQIGIMTIEDAFLAETVLPDRQTVADYMRPQIARAYKTGDMPPLLEYRK